MKPETCAEYRRLRDRLIGARAPLCCAVTAGLLLGALEMKADAYDGEEGYVLVSANTAGPALRDLPGNPSYQGYNRAVALFEDGKYSQALEVMRAAVRARGFGYPDIGLAFSNLCLMYLKVGKYKNAQAACTKALAYLPGYVPAALNLGRAKKRTEPAS